MKACSKRIIDNPKLSLVLKAGLGSLLVLLMMLMPMACGKEESTTPMPPGAAPNKIVVRSVPKDEVNIAFGIITDTHVSDQGTFDRNCDVCRVLNKACDDAGCLGVVHLGDMINGNSDDHLNSWRKIWENDNPVERRIRYVVFPGVGNHDVPPYHSAPRSWTGVIQYIGDRARGASGITSYSNTAYAWDWGAYHFIQLGLWAGSGEFEDKNYTDQNKLDWLANYLTEHVGDSGDGVLIFQHYGWDGFSTDGDWWSSDQRNKEAEILKNYKLKTRH